MPTDRATVRRNTLKRMALAAFVALAFTLVAKPAFAGSNDRVSFAQRIVVDQNDTAGDLVCLLCTIEVHGQVDGSVVSILGGVKNDGAVRGDMVSLLGNVNLAGTGSVDGDLVVMGGGLHKSQDARLGQNQVVFPLAVFLIPFAILGAIIWGITRIFRRRPVYFPTVGT
jgi:hypothetical protein